MTGARADAGFPRLWRWLSWPLLLLPLGLSWYFGLAVLGERVEQRRAVDQAAFESGFSPLRFDFTTAQQLIGREVQGGQFTPAVMGTTVVEPARIVFDEAGVYFGLRFDGRVLDLGVFRELMLLADASAPATLRVLLDGASEDAAWISAPIELPGAADVGWGRGLPASLIDLTGLAWAPRQQPQALARRLDELPRLHRAIRFYIESQPGTVLRLDSLGFAAEAQLDVRELRRIDGWSGPGPARHALEQAWSRTPQQLLALEPLLSGAGVWRAAAAYAGVATILLAVFALPASFLRRPALAACALLGALAMLNLRPLEETAALPLLLIGLASVMLGWEVRSRLQLRRPDWRLAGALSAAVAVSLVTGASISDDLRYLGFALLQQGLLLLVLWPALAVLDRGTRVRLLAAGFALMHLPNFELSLLCLLGGLAGLSWYARRGDALSLVLAHALIGLWLGRSDGYGWLWGLETGWRWFA